MPVTIKFPCHCQRPLAVEAALTRTLAMQYGTVKLDTDGIGQAARPGGHGDSGSVALATPPGPPQAS